MEACAIVPLPHTVDPQAAFASVGGEPALIRVVRSLRAVGDDATVVVACAPGLAAGARVRLGEAGLDVAVAVARDGASRGQVLTVGLKHFALERHSSVPVLVGDVRHPLSPAEVTGRLLEALRDGRDALVPVVPMTDTVKTVDQLGRVLGTVDRGTLRTVQYPRGFTASALWRVVSGSSHDGDDLDELTAAVRAGLDVGTVDGDVDCLGVDLPRDADLLAAIIACRPGRPGPVTGALRRGRPPRR